MEEDLLVLSHYGELSRHPDKDTAAVGNQGTAFRILLRASLFLGIATGVMSLVIVLQNPAFFWEKLVTEHAGAAIMAGVWILSSAWSKIESVCDPGRLKITPAAAIAFFSFYFTLLSLPIETRLDPAAFQLTTVPGMLVILAWIFVWHLLDLRLARLVP